MKYVRPFYKSMLTMVMGAFLVLLAACGPSVEGETERWGAYNKLIDAFIGDYPSFAVFFDGRRNELAGEWTTLEAIADKEARAKAMLATNKKLGELAVKISEYRIAQRKMSEIIEDIEVLMDKNRSSFPGIDRFDTSIDEFSRQGLESLGQGETILLANSPGSYDEAYASLTSAWKLTHGAYKRLVDLEDDIDTWVKKRIDEKEEAKKDSNTETP